MILVLLQLAIGLCKACAQPFLCAAGFEGLKSWFKDSLLGIADDLKKDQYKHLYKVPEWVRPWTAAVAKVGGSGSTYMPPNTGEQTSILMPNIDLIPWRECTKRDNAHADGTRMVGRNAMGVKHSL